MVEKLLRLCCFCVLLLIPLAAAGDDGAKKRFTLVIDAGHGGHDAGAVGAVSKEKNINLNVALAFGRLVEQNCPDVRVVYTRKTDVFIPLQRRADIANDNKADLFISIHTNSLPKGKIAYGAETYTLGMARAEANLEVAKRENSVILYEENYQEVYEGFDPTKAESYIIFEVMQDRYMKQSIDLARCIQRHYVSQAGRRNKGVHQAGFLVLRKTSMPAVLTELGFISTPAEENFLNSKEGIRKMAQSIYNGFVEYRRESDKDVRDRLIPVEPDASRREEKKEKREEKKEERREEREGHGPAENDRPDPESRQPAADAGQGLPVYKVQLFVASRKLPAGDARLKGLDNVDYYMDGNLYKYTYGATTDYAEANRLRRSVAADFPGTFVVAFLDGRRIDLNEARRLSKQKQ